jgi:hypothetical protein
MAAGPRNVHTEGNAVPELDDDLAGLLDDLSGIHPAIDLMRDAAQLIATDPLTLDGTQTLTAAIAGGADGTNVLNLFGQLIARITNPDTNPSLRTLPLDQQKTVQLHGECTAHVLAHPDLHQFASNTSAAIDGT